ncbi:MAG TPA: DUF1559 domain-containing protein [Planctomicrobium sp.]|nr:DUF1559 domain-containing protein [Planctomicrobium sp.]
MLKSNIVPNQETPLRRSHAGFTLIEFLVVIAITAIIVALSAPAILSSRELARRNTCGLRLREIWTGLNVYHDAHGSFPAGVISLQDPVPDNEDGEFRSWLPHLFGSLDQPLLADKWSAVSSLVSPEAKQLRHFRIPALICPSDSAPHRSAEPDEYFQSNYAGCHDHRPTAIASGNTGLLTLNERIRIQEIPDGSCCTWLAGEFRRGPTDLGWASGTRGTLRNTGTPINQTRDGTGSERESRPLDLDRYPASDSLLDDLKRQSPELAVQIEEERERQKSAPEPVPERSLGDPGGFGSYHAGGCYLLLADGRVRFVSQSIDETIYQQLGNRADGTLLSPDSF